MPWPTNVPVSKQKGSIALHSGIRLRNMFESCP